jgi:hypothetical protein
VTYRVSVRPPLVLGSLYSGRYVVGVDGFVFVVAVTGLSIGRLLYDELYDDPNVEDELLDELLVAGFVWLDDELDRE